MPSGSGIEMDYAASPVFYVDIRLSSELDGRQIQKTRSERQNDTKSSPDDSWEDRHPECLQAILGEIEEVHTSLRSLLSVFDNVYPCLSGESCIRRLTQVEENFDDLQPILVFVGTSCDADVGDSTPEMHQKTSHLSEATNLNGSELIRHISSQIAQFHLSKRILPLAVLHDPTADHSQGNTSSKSNKQLTSSLFGSKVRKSSASTIRNISAKNMTTDPAVVTKYVEIGAVEVLPSPVPRERLFGLAAHAYRAQKEAWRERAEHLRKRKARKLSWLGDNDERPYAYLREKMVSELMTGICNPHETLHQVEYQTVPGMDEAKEAKLRRDVGSWSYSGHEFNDDELIHGACLMLQHALSLPELEKWRISSEELTCFLVASRAAYNSFVNYHNFRHVIDVMQATFYFLIQIGTLPPFPNVSAIAQPKQSPSPIAALLKPFDALTLLITAIGHDVGHPGVNNAFLVSLNAPLAQLYNDKSVLEAFHCAAYSQILRRHWKASFEDVPMRGLMINSILATDMGVHMKYMSDLGNLQEKLHHNQGTDGWSAQILDEYRVLTCALLVKCADISNVARPFGIALKWADSLQLEFANQGVMEKELGIPTTLFGGPPELGNLIKLGKSQIGFMNIFARPLFEAVTDVLPAMAFAVEEMKNNQQIWANKIRDQEQQEDFGARKQSDPLLSPRSLSPNRPASQPEYSHPEGLPASNSPLSSAAMSPDMSAMDDIPRKSSTQNTIPLESNLLGLDPSRRSSGGHPLASVPTDYSSTGSFSRRSSGALSAANAPHSTITTRRTSNSSPSQLQLGQDSRSQTNSSTTTSENRQPGGNGSEDTLSQAHQPSTIKIASDQRQSSSHGGTGAGRLSSKSSGAENIRSINSSISQPSTRPNNHSGHHRSSSGAHTTNTNLSQSAPYSPTGTQATSFLTVDSDEGKPHGHHENNGAHERKGISTVANTDRHLMSQYGLNGDNETEARTSVLHNGDVKEASNSGYRSVGRKGSRFKLHFFKKRGRGVDTTP